MAPFDIAEVRQMMEEDDLELELIGDRKTALFCIVSDTDMTFNFISAMVYTQMFNVLCDRALQNGGALKQHVTCLLDEFANQKIPNFQHLISVIRSREISAHIVVQTQSQLKAVYKDHAETIIGNCSCVLFLGGKERSTLKEISETLGKETIDLFNTSDTRGSQRSMGINYQKLGNEQVSIETKMKVEDVLDMKAQHGAFIGPRAPFGYQKSKENPIQLVPDLVAAVIVRKIFEMAASGTGVTGIVRYLNERGLPTPIQYARAQGLAGNFDDGNGSWNSRSVKYILTNRTYTGMLVQGKEKRVVEATHEALVDSDTFDAIQKAFQARAYNVVPQGQSAENILKSKVICGCCGGKMQRKRGTDHADWHFFTCITKNRQGAGKGTGMYAREEDVLSAIYRQLKDYVNEHYITNSAYKQQIQEYTGQIADLSQCKTTAWINAMEHYEQYVQGEISKEEFRAVQDIANQAKDVLIQATEDKIAYEKQYARFCKLLSASSKDIPLSEIVDYIDKIVVDSGEKIVVEWSTSLN